MSSESFQRAGSVLVEEPAEHFGRSQFTFRRGCYLGLFCLAAAGLMGHEGAAQPLIPKNLSALEWIQFASAGYTNPVSGMIFDDRNPTCCGLALGGISTGCLDFEVNGTIGFDTIFQGYPRKLQRFTPFLGLAIDGKTWVLASPAAISGGILQGCHDPARDPYTGPRKWQVHVPGVEGVQSAKQIRYFAHYPAVNYEYETDAPVGVSLRAWSPFIPGDVAASSIPAIVFEVRLHNQTDHPQQGTLALNYPGVQMPTGKNVRWADAGNKGDFLLKPGAPPFDGQTVPETQPQFARPNPGRSVGGKIAIGDPSGDDRKEAIVGLRDGKTGRGFLVAFQRDSQSYGGRMDGKGKYEFEVIDILTDDGFSAVALGDADGNGRQQIVAGTLQGKVFIYRRRNPGFKADSVGALALYERRQLNPSQIDAGHISEIRIGDLTGEGKNQIVYTTGYKSPNSKIQPGAYWLGDAGLRAICADAESEFLGCDLGHYSGGQAMEIAVASKSGSEGKNGVKLYKVGADGNVVAHETVLNLPANHGPQWLVTGDFNGDGRDDLLAGTIGNGTLWMQRDAKPFGSEQSWSKPEVAAPEDFAAYANPLKGYRDDPKTYVAVGGQNTVLLGRLDGPEVPPGTGTAWAQERYHLGPHQAAADTALPAVALGDLSGDNVLDVLTWDSKGELTGVTYEGGKFFNIPRLHTLERKAIDKPQAVVVSLPHREQYSIMLLDGKRGRFGGDLGKSSRGWADFAKDLPLAGRLDTGASAAVDFQIAPRETTVIRFALAWYVPQWRSTFTYTRMNLMRYRDVTDVNREIDENHGALWDRIRRWQGVVDIASELPIELKDALINSLSLIAEDSYWAVPESPLGNWCFPGGLYAMIESPRAAPQTECIPCTWYGNIPVLYFFPELMRTTLRAYKEYQRPSDGAMMFSVAPRDELWWMGDHALENQIALNGFCFVDLVHRQWLRTGDSSIVEEFYPAAKAATQFAVNCRPKEYGLIHMPFFGSATEWWEGWAWEGLTAHAGSLNLAGLLQVERMAKAAGDRAFAGQCRKWFEEGSRILEEHMWNGQTYLLFKNPATGRIADDIMANQFDAEWVSFFGNLPRVFNPSHFRTGMKTVRRACLVQTGVASFASKEGTPHLKAYGNFIPEMFILGMTYMYAGDKQTGLDICRRTLDNLYKRQRYAFDWPNQIDCETGHRTYGSDYYQNMVVWAVPAALAKADLATATSKGSFIDKIMQAGKAPSRLRMDAPPKPKGTHDQLVPAYIPPTTGEVKRHETKEEKKKRR